MEVRTSTSEKFVLQRAVNRGGEAQIWTVGQDPHLVAKLYHKPTAEHEAKLMAMIAAPLPRKGVHPAVAWPLQLLYHQQRFVGYFMPRAAGSLPLFHFYNPARRRRLGLSHAWPRFLHRTATNLAAAVELVHAHSHVIGDLNESNVLVTQTALVTLVDTDSFQIDASKNVAVRVPSWLGSRQTGQIYRCGVGKAEYTPPELQGVDFKSIDRTPDQDNFALAVLVFYLLMDGFHPFAGVLAGGPSVGRVDLYGIKHGLFPYLRWGGNAHNVMQPPPTAPAFAHLHPGLQDAFRRTFIDGHAHPDRRVTAKEWKQLLHEAEAALVICPQNATHLYSRHLRHCPTCTPTAASQPQNTSSPNANQFPQRAHNSVATTPQKADAIRNLFPNSSTNWFLSIWQATGQQIQQLSQIKLILPQLTKRLSTGLHQLRHNWRSYGKQAQATIATLPDRLATVQRITVTYADLLGSWWLGNLFGMSLATLAAVGGYALLPTLLQFTLLSVQGQAMLILVLFAALWGAFQSYALPRALLPQPYLRYAWVGVTALSGAVVGAASFRLLGADWQQVSAWSAQPLVMTTLAALFGLVMGFLQSLLLRQQLRLADDGRVWTIANAVSGVLTAQGWLWGQSFPYTWSLWDIPDWQINGGLGALVGIGIGALLNGGVLVWMVQGPRRTFHLHRFALSLLRWPVTPIRLRSGAVRWVRALLLLVSIWLLLQLIFQLEGISVSTLPPLPNETIPHLLPAL